MIPDEQGQWISEVRQKLELGFFVNNLKDIGGLLHKMSLATYLPSACFVLCQAALIIASRWDERALTTAEVHSVETRMKPLFLACLEAMERRVPPDEIERCLDQLVLALLALDI